jgi:hypothetical protein
MPERFTAFERPIPDILTIEPISPKHAPEIQQLASDPEIVAMTNLP